MQFHIPAAEDEIQAERILANIAKHISAPVPPVDRRIRKVTWQHNGTRYSAEVGQPIDRYFGGDLVIAILHSGNCYCICTRDRGVVRGSPIYAGDGESTAIVYFDKSDAERRANTE
jgi:hypothetical protein